MTAQPNGVDDMQRGFFSYSGAELEARTMNALGQIPHGSSSGGLSARVLAEGRGVGVIVGLGSREGITENLTGVPQPKAESDDLWFAVVWLTDGRTSGRQAQIAMSEFERGEREAEAIAARGLVAVDGYPDPNGEQCVREPFHWGECLPGGIGWSNGTCECGRVAGPHRATEACQHPEWWVQR